jgi:DNA-binding transcriptional MerR regulator
MQDPKPSHKDIPDKLYFRIGEVSKITGLPTHVLRFWESEFSRIRPKRTASGQRLYIRRDIELILQIKNLLYERKFTIQGARQHLTARPGKKRTSSTQLLDDLRSELKSIKDLLG